MKKNNDKHINLIKQLASYINTQNISEITKVLEKMAKTMDKLISIMEAHLKNQHGIEIDDSQSIN